MRFVPVQFGQADSAILQAYAGDPLALAPVAEAVRPPQPRQLTTRLREFLDEVRDFREKLAALRSETEREREAAREAAAKCWELALLYYDLHARFAASFAESGDPILQTLANLNEEIAVELEDTAESEALAASKPFARLVDREMIAFHRND